MTIRSLLCVPAHKPHLYEKALSYGADCIMYDLEDSVPEAKKLDAFHQLSAWLKSSVVMPWPGLVTVRINRPAEGRELIKGRLDAFVLPKVKIGEDVASLSAFFRPVIPVVETPQAIVNLEEIVERSAGCIFGVADFAAGMGVSDRFWGRTRDRSGRRVNERFAYAKQKLATYCAAYAKPCLDTCFVVKGEGAPADVALHWEVSRSYGFTGGAAIHPMQVAIANDIFGPTAQEKAWADRTEKGHQERGGEVSVDEYGFVVGMPVARQARAILRS